MSEVRRGMRFARIISWIGHPLVFVTISVGIVVYLRLADRVGLGVLLALLVSIVLPTTLLLWRGVHSGRWKDADVSIHGERMRFYPGAIMISAFGATMLYFLRPPSFVTRGAFVTLALLVLAAIMNFAVKLSLHALFAFYCATILWRIHPVIGAAASSLALLVFWSRLYLRRHSMLELLTGTFFGVLGGITVAWWP